MMARIIAKKSLLLREATAIRINNSSNSNSNSCSIILASHHHHHQRHQSSQATKPKKSELPEIEREEYDAGMKLLEDHIQRMIVRKSTPDWLPFLPGSSFWVPPTPSPSTFFHNISSSKPNLHDPLFLSLRDSPTSQSLFIPENEYAGVQVNNTTEGLDVVTVKVKVLTMPENISLSEDEEG